MLRGNWHGQILGSGTDAWKYWAELRAGNITEEDWAGVESGIARSQGTCMTMGTAATMMSARRGAGLHAAGRVVDPRAPTRATRPWRPSTGRRIVEMVWEDLDAGRRS